MADEVIDAVIKLASKMLVHINNEWEHRDHNRMFHAGMTEYSIQVLQGEFVVATYAAYARNDAQLKKAYEYVASKHPNYTKIQHAKR
jgi:hypothetical protein